MVSWHGDSDALRVRTATGWILDGSLYRIVRIGPEAVPAFDALKRRVEVLEAQMRAKQQQQQRRPERELEAGLANVIARIEHQISGRRVMGSTDIRSWLDDLKKLLL